MPRPIAKVFYRSSHDGGDADTNAAVVGALLGAKYGFSSIPAIWVNELREAKELNARINRLLTVLGFHDYRRSSLSRRHEIPSLLRVRPHRCFCLTANLDRTYAPTFTQASHDCIQRLRTAQEAYS